MGLPPQTIKLRPGRANTPLGLPKAGSPLKRQRKAGIRADAGPPLPLRPTDRPAVWGKLRARRRGREKLRRALLTHCINPPAKLPLNAASRSFGSCA
jgi:hypothetical protein